MGPLTLPTLEARATNLTGKPKVSAAAKGPVRLVGTSDADVEKLLRHYGLKSLSGSAEVDLRANYDRAKPQSWDASGSLVMKGVKAVSHPAGVRLDDLKGRVTFKRKKTLDLTLENLTARVSQAPVGLEGKLSGVGSPRLTVDAKARTEQLDLKQLSALFPQLEEFELGGKLDMDITIYYPQAAPAKSRLNGKVKTRGLDIRLAAPDVKLTNGDADIELAGNTAKIRKMTLLANDQKMDVSGQVTNFSAPKAKLMAKSPDLNLDRLLVSLKEDPTPAKSTSKPPAKKKGVPRRGTGSKKKAAKSELPSFLRKVTAELQAEAKRGQYRGQEFQDLKFRGQYERGVLKSHELDVRMAGGHIVTKGSADFRKPKRVPFNVQPTITAVRLESIAPLLGTKKVSAHGPLSLTGQVQGRTGSKSELLGSLLGNVEGVMGPGRFYKLDPAGEAIFHLLSFINLRGILSGKMAADAASKGIPYDSLKLQASFKNGNMSVNRFNLETPALTMDGQGTVDLVYRKLNMGAHVKALGTVDGLLGLVPVVGAAAESMSDVYLDLEGPVENPRISVRPTKSPTEAEKDKPEEGAKDVDDVDKVIKGLGDVFEQILGK
jgi:uncharacterized protein YhdP